MLMLKKDFNLNMMRTNNTRNLVSDGKTLPLSRVSPYERQLTLTECSRHSPSSSCTLHTSHSIFFTCTLLLPWVATKTSGQMKFKLVIIGSRWDIICQHSLSITHPHRSWLAQWHQWKRCREASRRKWVVLCSDRRSGRPVRPPALSRRCALRRRLGPPPGRSAGPAGGWRCCSVLAAERAPR